MKPLQAFPFALAAAIGLLSALPARAEPLYSLDSTSLGEGRMAIAVREVERRGRAAHRLTAGHLARPSPAA